MRQEPSPPPLPYQGFVPPPTPPPKRSHDQIFTGLLIALSLLLMLAIGEFSILRAGGRFNVAEGVFYYLIFANSFYVFAIIVALILRWRAPRMRRAITIAVSAILLFAFPFGTIIGIYGLAKVDRATRT